MPAPTLFWRGDFIGEGSLARVNRFLAAALLAEGVRVVPWGEPATAVEQQLGIDPHPIEAAVAGNDAVLTLRHRWPPEFLRPARGRYVHMQPWEYGAIPARWIDALAGGADDVWCYSTFVRDRYVESGIPADRVHVVPLGYDPAIYDPAVEPMPVDLPNDTCLFLFCSGLTPRKNVAAAVAAYTQAFSSRDRVALLIKDNSAMAAYARDTTADEMKTRAARTDIAPVRYVDANLDDGGMARLYRASAALLHPSKGEGFGLPILEAMGCGTPAIVAAGTATDDVVDDTTAYRVASRRGELGRVGNGLELAGEGWWMEPEVDALADAMRQIYRDRDAAAARGRAAAVRAWSGWTWTNAGRIGAQRIDTLLARPPRASDGASDPLRTYRRAWFSRNGIDGMLLELFARVRFERPSFVEIAATDTRISNVKILARIYGWSGVIVAASSAAAAATRTEYAANPAVAVVEGDAVGGRTGVDLLSIERSGSSDAAQLLALRPRVVVLGIDVRDDAALTRALAGGPAAYVQLDTSPLEERLFVLREIAERAGFA